MKTSNKGLAEIAGHEGIISSPYFDSVGVLTFGIGHTKSAGGIDPATLPMGSEQPLSLVMDIFRQDITRVEERVNRAVKVPITQQEFDALVSFDFNTGGIFRAKLVEALNSGDKVQAGRLFDSWHKPPEIIRRRNREKELFTTGNYTLGGMALVAPVVGGYPKYSAGKQVNVLEIVEGKTPETPPATTIKKINDAAAIVLLTGIGGWSLFTEIGIWAAVVGVAVIAGFIYLRFIRKKK